MKRHFIFFTILSVSLFVVNAQNTNESLLSRLKTQCNQVVELENSIASKQANLSELNNSINNLRQLWQEICTDYFNDPNSTADDFADLLAETDINEESELYKDLEWAKDHPSINERRSRPQNNSGTKKPTSSSKSSNDATGSDVRGRNAQPQRNDTKDSNADPTKVNTDNPSLIEAEPEIAIKKTEEDKKAEDSKKAADPTKTEVSVKGDNPDKGKEDITKKTETSGPDKSSIVRNRKNKTGNPQ